MQFLTLLGMKLTAANHLPVLLITGGILTTLFTL